ncbi:hypothetical protein ACQKCH_03860 [Nubsella zeaxanthinifaciens]|uniref:hypothetical protein n=1 Tax=Nubsella zeaxanthinifaciens TaxID=392412 RepID=UPI003CFD21CD
MMKYLSLGMLASLLWLGCYDTGIKAKLPGRYTRYIQGDYGLAWDTLTIVHLRDHRYHVKRSTGSRSRLDGKLLAKKLEHRNWQTELDLATGVLSGEAFAPWLRWVRDSSKVYLGGLAFQKNN